MDIYELKARYPRLYQQVFDLGVQSERRKVLAADLIGNAKPDEVQPAVFTPRSIQNALAPKRGRPVRSPWVTSGNHL
jgi:hypothetical protein